MIGHDAAGCPQLNAGNTRYFGGHGFGVDEYHVGGNSVLAQVIFGRFRDLARQVDPGFVVNPRSFAIAVRAAMRGKSSESKTSTDSWSMLSISKTWSRYFLFISRYLVSLIVSLITPPYPFRCGRLCPSISPNRPCRILLFPRIFLARALPNP